LVLNVSIHRSKAFFTFTEEFLPNFNLYDALQENYLIRNEKEKSQSYTKTKLTESANIS
jgi:hypothetical protein